MSDSANVSSGDILPIDLNAIVSVSRYVRAIFSPVSIEKVSEIVLMPLAVTVRLYFAGSIGDRAHDPLHV
jgi:hypothetical protein